MNKRLLTICLAASSMLMPVFLLPASAAASPQSFDSKVHVFAINPSDPFFTTDRNNSDLQWYLPKMQIPEAWEYTKGSGNVVVAIVDTGIHASHIELNDGRVIAGYNTITNQPILAGADSDDNGHGTAVAGVIGAIADNQHGIAGINWRVSLMPIKAVGPDGTGDLSAVAAGIVWATDHGAEVINLSLGGTSFGGDNTLSQAITYAYRHNVLLVASAGNDSQQQGINLDRQPAYPVCGDNGENMIVGVAATDVNDQKAAFSDYGSTCIDISAPGSRILTTAFLPGNPSNNILIYGSGTSLAAPMVSGVAALIKSLNSGITNVDLQKLIMRSADNIYPLNQTSCANTSCNGFLGSGRINALSALAPVPLTDGSLVRQKSTGQVYLVTNNSKSLVTDFVFAQRGFSQSAVTDEINNQLANLLSAPALPPLEGTLIKKTIDATVYVTTGSVIRPVTYVTFISRGFSFSKVLTISDSDLAALEKGDWYWPPDGTTVLIDSDPTVYAMDQQVVRPVTYFVFTQRRLSFARVIKIDAGQFQHLPKPGDNYWLSPLDGTLVKTAEDPTVYVIEGGARHPLTYETFIARRYNFRSIKTLPQVELDIISPGGAL